jgi:hypothetical protein
MRQITLPGAADSWPTQSSDLAGWPLWCLSALVGALFFGCGLALLAVRRQLQSAASQPGISE